MIKLKGNFIGNSNVGTLMGGQGEYNGIEFHWHIHRLPGGDISLKVESKNLIGGVAHCRLDGNLDVGAIQRSIEYLFSKYGKT